MINIQIVEATINDIEVLQKIGRQTFSETFAASNSLENTTQYLETGFSTEKLLAELENTNAAFYIVKSENEGNSIIFLKISKASACKFDFWLNQI